MESETHWELLVKEGRLDPVELARLDLQKKGYKFHQLPPHLQELEPIGAEEWYDTPSDTWKTIHFEERVVIYKHVVREARFDLLEQQAAYFDALNKVCDIMWSKACDAEWDSLTEEQRTKLQGEETEEPTPDFDVDAWLATKPTTPSFTKEELESLIK